MSIKAAIIAQDFAIKRMKSEQSARAAEARWGGGTESDIAPWVSELLGGLGISPEMLFSEEIPPEVAKFLPMVKGFVEGGGVQKILSQLSAGVPPSDVDTKGFI